MKKKNEEFEWIEIEKYNVFNYCDKYKNKYYDILKRNNIECLTQVEYYPNNSNKNFYCTIYVQTEDYHKGKEILKQYIC